jgi:hypothetical protein
MDQVQIKQLWDGKVENLERVLDVCEKYEKVYLE